MESAGCGDEPWQELTRRYRGTFDADTYRLTQEVSGDRVAADGASAVDAGPAGVRGPGKVRAEGPLGPRLADLPAFLGRLLLPVGALSERTRVGFTQTPLPADRRGRWWNHTG